MFQSIVIVHGIVYAKAAEFVQSANKIAVLLFGFFPVAILISTRFQHVMSQMKQNKFLIKLRVMIKLVSYCVLHTVDDDQARNNDLCLPTVRALIQ